MSSRRFAILMACLFLLLLGLSILQGTLLDHRKPELETLPNRSVYNTRPSGYAAWYQALQESHVPLKVWTKGAHDLNKEKGEAVMLMVEPHPLSMTGETFSPNEQAGLLYWVSNGNTLILLDPFQRESTRNILKRLDLAAVQKTPIPESLTDSDSKKAKHKQLDPLDLSARRDIPASPLTLNLSTLPKEFQWMDRLLEKVPQGISTQAETRFPATTDNVPLALEHPDAVQATKEAVTKKETPPQEITAPDSAETSDEKTSDEEPANEDEGGKTDPAPKKEDPYSLDELATQPYHPIVLARDNENHPYLIGGSYGQGLLILGTPTDLAENGGLFKLDNNNFQFLTNLVTLSGKPILLNEFVHGHQDKDSVYSILAQTPLGIIFSQLVLLFCLVLWGSFRRWRPTLEELQPLDGTASQEFVSSISRIYQRVNATPLAIAPLMNTLEALIRTHRVCEFKNEADLDTLNGLSVASYTLTPIDINTLKKGHTVVHKQKKLGGKETLRLSQDLSHLIYCLQGSKQECILPQSVSSSH